MSNKEESTTPGVRQVVVDIATHDDDGNLITDAMLSSGGARDRGPLLKQYTNPRPYKLATVRSREDREFDLRMQREAAARQRREEMAEARRMEEDRELMIMLLRAGLDLGRWIFRETVAPWAKTKWDERKTRKLVLREAEVEGALVVDSPALDQRAVIVLGGGAVVTEPAILGDIDLAPVVQIDDYRRSA